MSKTPQLTAMAIAAILVMTPAAFGADPGATINKVNAEGVGEAVGTVSVVKSNAGATFNLTLKGLPPGAHGLHIHENGACGPSVANGNPVPAGGAGGHWDADHAGKHAGPTGQGHLGDLPLLEVLPDGTATKTIIAPRIKDIEAVRGHALVIHAGGDNYADEPAPLGGGGPRIACGVIR